jgi:hypothetical protein
VRGRRGEFRATLLCAATEVPPSAEQQRAGWDRAEDAARRRNEPDDAQASSPFLQHPTPSAAPPLALTTPNTSSRPALPPATCSPCGAAGGARRTEACGLGRRGKPRCKTRPTAQRPLRCANARHQHSFAAAPRTMVVSCRRVRFESARTSHALNQPKPFGRYGNAIYRFAVQIFFHIFLSFFKFLLTFFFIPVFLGQCKQPRVFSSSRTLRIGRLKSPKS